MGHGQQTHVRSPQCVQLLIGERVVDVAAGSQHCLVLTDDGDLYSWGKNSNGEVDGSGDSVSLPRKISELSGRGAVSIACGAFEVCAIEQ